MKSRIAFAAFGLMARLLAALLATLTLSTLSASAQPAKTATSTLTGRVRSAVSGQYLANVRVTVVGTNIVAFTDETGAYRISVPPGNVSLQVFYTGMEPQTVAVQAAPGVVNQPDLALSRAVANGSTDKVEQLDAFVVSNSKFTEGAEMAINEQRFAPNLKNVVSTDAFGTISEGNVAEFMKFMPGISVEYEGDAPTTIQVRGFNASMTQVMIDGAQMANAVRVGDSREFHFKQVSINDTSRIDVTKVPTPAPPASPMAVSINLISKSAFERENAQFNYNVYLSGNNRAFTLQRTPHTNNKYLQKMNPNLSFDYTLPITKNLGLVVTGLTSVQYVSNSYDTMTWNAAGTGTGASISKPFLASYSVVDFPGYHNRFALSLKVDWRPTPSSVLSIGGSSTYYQDFNGNDTIVFNAGTNATPTPATGTKFSYGPDFTVGATGRGALTMSNNHSHILGQANQGNIHWRFEHGDWHADASASYSKSRTWRRYLSWGNFRGLSVSNANPVRVSFSNITSIRPGKVEVFDNNNNPVDFHDLANYRITGSVGQSTGDVKEQIASANFNLRRELRTFAFPLALQVGGRGQRQARDRQVDLTSSWTYAGPGGSTSAAPYLSNVYAGYKTYPGVGTIPWTSPEVAYDAWVKNPSLFTKSPAQIVAELQDHMTNSWSIKETAQAYYLQADARLMHNRLRILTGVRFEDTNDEGRGPLVDPDNVYARAANGSFVHDAKGARVRKPEAGAVGSLQELLLTTTERGAESSRGYDGYYPSLHFTYNVSDNFLVRLAYAKTYGRPDFDSVIPQTRIVENDDLTANPAAGGGTLTVSNTGLRPWTADNYDLSTEYYTSTGGVFSAGAFVKDISHFFNDTVKIADAQDLAALGLGQQYLGWELHTRFNGGDAKVSGYELNARNSLRPLGRWGSYFEVFANMTHLKLEGDRDADFTGFVPLTVNWGVSFTKKPIRITANWSHRGKQRLDPNAASGPDGYTYWDARTTLDVGVTYLISKSVSLYANARNVLNVKPRFMRYSSATPDYARLNRTENYGVKFAVGIKGTF